MLFLAFKEREIYGLILYRLSIGIYLSSSVEGWKALIGDKGVCQIYRASELFRTEKARVTCHQAESPPLSYSTHIHGTHYPDLSYTRTFNLHN